MKEYQRRYPTLSACGLNCGLCPRYYTDGSSNCPGCGGKDFFSKRPSCGILSCCQRHDEIEFCYLCDDYACKKYDRAPLVDSFISHRNMLTDFAKAKQIGLDVYMAELNEKMTILEQLLNEYNDGRRKSLFCLAVSLLSLEDLKTVLSQINKEVSASLPLKEKAKMTSQLLQDMAEKREITLTLNKKVSKKTD